MKQSHVLPAICVGLCAVKEKDAGMYGELLTIIDAFSVVECSACPKELEMFRWVCNLSYVSQSAGTVK